VSQRRPARVAALRALEAGCPRCGARRSPRQRYCLECGLALPAVTGGLASLRRAWIIRLGWYPGDAVWPALALAAVALAGGALALARPRSRAAPAVIVAPSLGSASAPAGGTRALWPPGASGWTVVLSSLPASRGARAARALAARAAASGLPQVGVLESSRYASLLPGYFVVFSGVYGASSDAETALQSVLARGYGGAYPSRVAP
jgi:hypothetical protein